MENVFRAKYIYIIQNSLEGGGGRIKWWYLFLRKYHEKSEQLSTILWICIKLIEAANQVAA